MTESLHVDALALPVDSADDLLPELQPSGREAILGFSDMRPRNVSRIVPDWVAPASAVRCPNCANTKLLLTTGPRQQRNYLCRAGGMRWHAEFGQPRRVDRQSCPGCGFCEHWPAVESP
jgi:hypothetical protein